MREADQPKLTLTNFDVLVAATRIPLSAEAKAAESREIGKRIYGLLGLRYEQSGEVYERLGLTNLARTLLFAVMTTALALAICYPIAYKVALATPAHRVVWLMLGLIIPYAIAELMRIYAWTTIIDNRGVLNSLLIWTGILTEPIQFARMPGTVFVVIAYTYVLFMVFPMLNVMSTLDRNQIEAARDLGASPWRVHRRVVIPHAKPGIAVGCIATFMLAAGAFSVPRIISRGLQAEWFSQTIYNKFFESETSNVGAAYSFAYTLVCFLIVGLFMWIMQTRLKDFARVQ
ncbi:ABC transporter permease [Defluviimonas salinarum]|uniref:ABC transporter permease n=1 Tax=Defluviimonas salinarum TaxID=2992147 RepID=A0ABT3J770_9RHOB|nr:ABC transporter permease [Defluviimonas salinarum]MCW3783310.1 ABC transporter permease [Defluviimonas salinarum]